MAQRNDDDSLDKRTVETRASAPLSRRGFLKTAGVAGLAAAATPLTSETVQAAVPDGTPEQIHITWGEDPARGVLISWASPAQATNPQVRYGTSASSMDHTVAAVQRTYSDGLNGQTVFTYHARLTHLKPDPLFYYSVTADNDRNHSLPFAATFQTAPQGRAP